MSFAWNSKHQSAHDAQGDNQLGSVPINTSEQVSFRDQGYARNKCTNVVGLIIMSAICLPTWHTLVSSAAEISNVSKLGLLRPWRSKDSLAPVIVHKDNVTSHTASMAISISDHPMSGCMDTLPL